MKPLEQKRIDLPEVKKKRRALHADRTPPGSAGRDPVVPEAITLKWPNSKVVKLIGTTKATIDQVRNRTHWNSNQFKPVDPVSLGLCTQIELDEVVLEAAAAKARADARAAKAEAQTLKTAQETVPAETYDQPGDEG